MKQTKRTAGSEAYVSTVPFTVTARQHVMNEYSCFIHGDIKDPSDFQDSLHALSQAEETDTVVLHINSTGGCLAATDSLITAIEMCQGRVVAMVTGNCMSAATMILLAVDEYYVSPRAQMMVHSVSFGAAGQHGEVVGYVNFVDKQTKKLMVDSYEGMFTEEEFNFMYEGKSYYMSPEEWQERFDKRQELLEKKQVEQEKQQRKALQQAKRAIRTQTDN
jgi:ATP-dependent protease ClpP protease subunit